MTETPEPSAFARQWNHRPDQPVQTSPLFAWPPRPGALWRWFSGQWFALAENTLILGLAVVIWMAASPGLETTATLAPGWIAGIYLRNLVLMALVAGGLHYWFHGARKQGDHLKFDPRAMGMTGRVFTFGNQIHDNMFWSLASGVGFWTAWEVLLLWAMGNGFAPVLDPRAHPIWFLVILLATPLWISFHFYWIHRLLHWPPLYRTAHALHHRNTNIGPWSGLSMHPIEACLFFSSAAIHLVVAAHPIHILFHVMHQGLTAATSHTGFENLVVKDARRLDLGRFHHQMHHRYFECNYGNLEVPWDKVFGSFHDGTENSHLRMKERLKRRGM